MKKTREIIGLPIISISDGNEIGNVKNLIINAESRTVNYIVVDSGVHLLGAKVIQSDRILGIGEYALTVEDENTISIISKVPSAIELLERNIIVKGTKMLTEKGKIVGEVTEIYFDEDDDCKIKGIEYRPMKGQPSAKFLPDKCVITYGKNLVVIYEAFESMVLDVDEN
jgi:uncharacterized protein YrrD